MVKNIIGRPPKKPNERQSRRFQIKLTEAEMEKLAAAAGDEPVSTWARRELLKIAGRKK